MGPLEKKSMDYGGVLLQNEKIEEHQYVFPALVAAVLRHDNSFLDDPFIFDEQKEMFRCLPAIADWQLPASFMETIESCRVHLSFLLDSDGGQYSLAKFLWRYAELVRDRGMKVTSYCGNNVRSGIAGIALRSTSMHAMKDTECMLHAPADRTEDGEFIHADEPLSTLQKQFCVQMSDLVCARPACSDKAAIASIFTSALEAQGAAWEVHLSPQQLGATVGEDHAALLKRFNEDSGLEAGSDMLNFSRLETFFTILRIKEEIVQKAKGEGIMLSSQDIDLYLLGDALGNHFHLDVNPRNDQAEVGRIRDIAQEHANKYSLG